MLKSLAYLGFAMLGAFSSSGVTAPQTTGVEYFQQRFDHFEASQKVVVEFDQKLDSMYQQKIQFPDFVVNETELEKERFKLKIALQMSEESVRQLEDYYQNLLVQAIGNDPANASLRAASVLKLKEIDDIFATAWGQGDRWTVISLAQELEGTFKAFSQTHPNAPVPRFHKYLEVLPSERAAAYDESLQHHAVRKENDTDRFLESEWSKYLTERLYQEINFIVPQPMVDGPSLFPSAGGQGLLTGNHFLPPGAWAITLDDGPHPVYTRKMMEILKAAGMPTTFFWLSQNLLLYPDVARTAGQLGFHRGSHSFTHRNLEVLKEPGLTHEIDEAGDVFAKVIGQRATFFRCPYGNCGKQDGRIRQKIALQHMMAVNWNVDSLDWQDKNPASIFARVKKQMVVAGHGIILLHDIHPQTVQALKLIVAYFQSQPGLRTYSMDEIMKLQTGYTYPSP